MLFSDCLSVLLRSAWQFVRIVSALRVLSALCVFGTGLALQDTPIPPKGTVVKKAQQMPSDEWLLGKFNFDLDGMTILK